jgi:hypothetical protein
LNNFKIEKNMSVNLEVRGDMGTTNVNDTVNLYIKDRSDIMAVGATYGYDLQLASTSYTKFDTGAEGITVTLKTSDFAIDMDKAATPSKDVKAGDTSVVLATLSFKTNGENATIKEIKGANKFTITGTGLTLDEVKNVRMVDLVTGATYDLDASIVAGRYDLTLSDEISLVKGVMKKFAVKADLNDTTGSEIDANDTLKVNLDASGMTVTGDVSNSSITVITPSSVSGSLMTVKAASLTSNVTNMTAKTVVTGSSDVEVYAAKLKTGAADGVKLNSVKFTTTANNQLAFSDNNITKLDLYVDGKLLKSVSNNIVEATAGTKGTITFNSLNDNEILANKEVNLVVKATFSSNFTNAGTFNLELAAAGDMIVRSKTGSKTVTVTGGITGGARAVTLASVGTLKVELLTTDTKTNQDQYILAGATSTSKYLGELKFTTANEPITVKTLTLTQLGSARSSDIAEVRLVKADGTTVISKSAEANGDIVFDTFEITFEADKSTSLFVAVIAKGINAENDASATGIQGRTNQFNLSAAAITAKGALSSTDIVMTGINTIAADNQWDNDATTKTFVTSGVVLNTITSAMGNGKLSSGRQDIGKYTLTFEHGANRVSNNDAYLAQLDYLKVSVNESGATTTNYSLRVEGTNREVADSATAGVWTNTELQNATTGLLNTAKLDNSVVLVVSADVAIDSAANNYSVQTRIADLNGTGNDDLRFSSLVNMYLPYTSVTGANLTN